MRVARTSAAVSECARARATSCRADSTRRGTPFRTRLRECALCFSMRAIRRSALAQVVGLAGCFSFEFSRHFCMICQNKVSFMDSDVELKYSLVQFSYDHRM